jgi:hypothetical protein
MSLTSALGRGLKPATGAPVTASSFATRETLCPSTVVNFPATKIAVPSGEGAIASIDPSKTGSNAGST